MKSKNSLKIVILMSPNPAGVIIPQLDPHDHGVIMNIKYKNQFSAAYYCVSILCKQKTSLIR